MQENRQENLPTARIVVVVGNYGSGKTEISLNLALKYAQRGEQVTLVDLDIVNPYFRSSERTDLLEAHGIRVYAPSFAMTTVDVPSLPAELPAPAAAQGRRVLPDVGGDATGAAALEIQPAPSNAASTTTMPMTLLNAPRRQPSTVHTIKTAARTTSIITAICIN